MPKVGQPLLVLVRPDRLGDAILSSTVLAPTLRAYGKTHRLIWSVRGDYVPLFDGISGIESLSCETLHAALSSQKDTNIIFLNPDTELENQLSASGTIFTWGKTLPDERKLCLRPEAEEAAILMKAARFPIESPGYPLVIPKEPLHSASLPPGPYIILHISAYGKKPTLPVETLLELTVHFQHAGNTVVWLGLDERPDSQWLGRLSMESKAIAINRPTIPELYPILKNADGVIGRDSGVCHLAAAIGTPTVAIVGPLGKRKAARRWSPVGQRVKIIEADLKPRWWESDLVYQNRCFAAVKAVEIAEALEKLM